MDTIHFSMQLASIIAIEVCLSHQKQGAVDIKSPFLTNLVSSYTLTQIDFSTNSL